MSGKKYKRLLERLKYQSSPTYECMLYELRGVSIDEFIHAKYRNKCFHVLHNICGGSVNERYGDYDIEHFLDLDEENTRKMMLRTGSHDGESLIKAIKNRFGSHGAKAMKRIEEFCQEKGIEYKTSVY